MMKWHTWIPFSLLLASLASPAQEMSITGDGTSGHVGGGREKELELKRMMYDLSLYLESKEGREAFPEVMLYDQAHPEETVGDLLRSVSLVFKSGKVYDGFDGDRDCVSHFENSAYRYIQCDNDARLDPTDLNAQPALYAFLFHEVLVQAALEGPVSKELPSVYPISSRLKFHREVYEKMLPGEAVNPLSTPRKVRYGITNWRELGYSGPSILQIDLDAKTARILLDPFLGDSPLAMSAAIQRLPYNHCIVLTNSSHGEQSLYCEDLYQKRVSGTFHRSSGSHESPAGDRFTLASLAAFPSGLPYQSRGGLFRLPGTDRVLKVDPVLEEASVMTSCQDEAPAYSQYFKFHPAASSESGLYGFDFSHRDGFEYSLGKGKIVSCVYLDADKLSCGSGAITAAASILGRVTEWKTKACATGSAANSDPAHWKNAVVAPDGTIWSDVIGLYQNCLGGGPGQSGHYLDSLCHLDSNDSFAGQVSFEGRILESDAVAACERIGGKLPTLRQFESLPVEPRYWPGVEAPHHKPVQFWTSTLNPDGIGAVSAYGDPNVPGGRSAYVFVMYGDESGLFEKDPSRSRVFIGTIATDNRNWLNYVRCVDRD